MRLSFPSPFWFGQWSDGWLTGTLDVHAVAHFDQAGPLIRYAVDCDKTVEAHADAAE
ncbi:hypothetical protein ABIB14_000216 [Arthrobacter sp. UYEF3]